MVRPIIKKNQINLKFINLLFYAACIFATGACEKQVQSNASLASIDDSIPGVSPPSTTPDNNSSEPQDNSKLSLSSDFIVFIADRTSFNQHEIYGVDYDGKNLTKLSGTMPSNGDVYTLSLSSDKTQLAYIADKDVDNTLNLYVKNLTTNSEIIINEELLDDRDVKDFQWSPDNLHIAYLSDQDTDNIFELYVAKSDATTNVKVSSTIGFSRDIKSFAWNNDGTKIAYISDQDTDNIFELYIVDSDGSNQIKVSDTLVNGGVVDSFLWSPDGTKILYTADQEIFGIKEVYVITISELSVLKVSDTLATDFTGSIDGTNKLASWSPDSSKISYVADQNITGVFELYNVNSDGTEKIKISGGLSSGDSVKTPKWINNSQIAYKGAFFENGSLKNKLLSVNYDSTDEIILSDPAIAGGDIIGNLKVSPNGEKICFRADKETDNKTELYIVNIDGTSAEKVSISDLPADSDVSDGVAWSPDGTKIAYIADQENDGIKELFITNISDLSNLKVSDTLVFGGEVSGFIFAGDTKKNKISIGGLLL